MNNQERAPKVVCLFGAGLSVPAGLPASVQLANMFKEEMESLETQDSSNSALKLLHYYIEGGIRFQKAKCGLNPSEPINIEEVAIAARHLANREDNPLAPFVAGWHPYLSELLGMRHGIGILDEYQRKLRGFVAKSLQVPSFTEIAYLDRLTNLARAYNGLDVFTLNYDCCVESAVEKDCKAGGDLIFVDGFNEQGWSPELYRKTDNGLKQFRLYKVHGSLDWVMSEEYGLVCLRKTVPDIKTELYGMDSHIVFGTDTKLSGEQPFFTLAHFFCEILSSADILLVIGYGFADRYINSIIEDRLRSHKQMNLIVVGPNCDLLITKTKLLKGSPRVHPIKESAKTALENRIVIEKINAIWTDSDSVPF